MRSVRPAVEDAENPKPEILGLVEAHAFTVDTQAPARPRILTPTNGSTVGANPWFSFDAEEFASVPVPVGRDGRLHGVPAR